MAQTEVIYFAEGVTLPLKVRKGDVDIGFPVSQHVTVGGYLCMSQLSAGAAEMIWGES